MPRVPLWRRYERLFGSDPAADVKLELQFHLEAKVDDLIGQGWRPAEARREAERQFGDVLRVQREGERMGQERERRVNFSDFWSACAQDIRYGFRTLRRDRAFTIITVLLLSLGIGANTAVFSVVNTVLLGSLPFPESHRLVWFTAGTKLPPELREAAGLSAVTYTVSAYEEFQRHNRSFQSVTSYNPFFGNSEYTLTGGAEPQSVAGVMVAGNFFQTLGVQPVLGRLFDAEECRKNGRAAVLLNYGFWKSQFAGNPNIVGAAIALNKRPVYVVGVLPPGFDFGGVFSPGLKIDVYVPAVMDTLRGWGNTLAVMGRLKPQATVAQAQAEADTLFPQLKAAHPDWPIDYSSNLMTLRDFVSGTLRRPLMVLWCAVGLILLIVCVNLSNLMLAHTGARGKEFAMRTALGAGRERLFRQLFTESFMLAMTGTALGLVLALTLTAILSHRESIALPLLSSVKVDGAALAWTMLIAAMATLLFGFIPGLKLGAGNIQIELKESGPGMTAGRGQERLRSMMAVSEVALACVLLISAGLLLRSFLKVLDVDPGFRPSQAAVLKLDFDGVRDPGRRGAALQEILRQVQSVPGVEGAGVVDMLPLGRNRSWQFSAADRPNRKGEITAALVRIATPGYLATMGMHLRDGRDFEWQDSAQRENVVIVNQAAARRYWPGDSPVGRLSIVDGYKARVIGVISDVREDSLEVSAKPEIYLPAMQADPEGAELVVRSKLPPRALAPGILQRLRRLNPSQPASELRPLQDIVDQSVSPRRFLVVLVGSLALLGLVVASLGIYGVISCSVTRQVHEMGIRMALGASADQVQLGVVLKTVRLALTGIALGTAGAMAVAKWIGALLFETSASDPMTFAGIALLLGAVAVAAGYIPARRASRIDPVIALRN